MLRESDRDLTYDDANRAAEAPARSLSPASDQYMIEGTIVRNLDKVTDVQASLRFDQTDSLALLGLGADGVGPALRRQSRTQNWEGSTSINGMLDDWRWALTGTYAAADQRPVTEQDDGTRDRYSSHRQHFGATPNNPAQQQ